MTKGENANVYFHTWKMFIRVDLDCSIANCKLYEEPQISKLYKQVHKALTMRENIKNISKFDANY